MPKARRDRTSRRIIRSREREAKALELRLAGAGYQEIARVLGISLGAAHKAVTRALSRLPKAEDVEAVRQLELSRLDAALQAIWRKVAQGDLQAIDRLLKIMERKAKLLGLDEPERARVQQEIALTLEMIVVRKDDREHERDAAESEASGLGGPGELYQLE